MNRFVNAVATISRLGILLSFIGMIAAVVIQVFARFFLPVAPNWTEEVARILFIYTLAFGGGLAIRKDAFVKLDFLKYYMNARAYRQLQVSIMLCIVVFSLVVMYQGWLFALIGVPEKSPALLVSMVFVFFSLPLMMFSLFLFSLEKLVQLLNTEPEAS